MELSVTEYAKSLGVTRQAVLLQIKEKRLAKGVTCKKIGNTYSLFVQDKNSKPKNYEKHKIQNNLNGSRARVLRGRL